MRLRFWWAACLMAVVQAGAQAQDTGHAGIPDDVYYLMPDFAEGLVFLEGQAPARGMLNICALDHTLRFKDKNGQELSAGDNDAVVRVRIDTVVFLRDGGAFYRLYPVTPETGVALRRDVRPVMDAKTGAYGTVSQTSSIRQAASIYSDGVAYNLDRNREYPYDVDETLFMYKGNDVLSLSRKNLRKCFPERKEEIDAWFKAGNALPEDLDDALSLISRWARP